MAHKDNAVASFSEERLTNIKITKDQASKLSVGKDVDFGISGEVVSVGEIRYPDERDKGKFEVGLKKVSISGLEGNSADKALKKITRKT